MAERKIIKPDGVKVDARTPRRKKTKRGDQEGRLDHLQATETAQRKLDKLADRVANDLDRNIKNSLIGQNAFIKGLERGTGRGKPATARRSLNGLNEELDETEIRLREIETLIEELDTTEYDALIQKWKEKVTKHRQKVSDLEERLAALE